MGVGSIRELAITCSGEVIAEDSSGVYWKIQDPYLFDLKRAQQMTCKKALLISLYPPLIGESADASAQVSQLIDREHQLKA